MLKNPEKTVNEITEWIRQYFRENGPDCFAVVGISGGKDSSVAAALCARALGTDRVVGILMPDGVQKDIADARNLAEYLGIRYCELNIGEAADAMRRMIGENEALQAIAGTDGLTRDAGINLPPRLRMATLYAAGQMLPKGGRVVNTCNRSEDYVGYSTKFGDSAGDFSPLSGLLVHEVLQVGEVLGLPDSLVHKTPSDGLSGMSDEDKLGFTYAELDHYVLTGRINDEEKRAKIDRLHRLNLHKLQLMPAFSLSADEQEADRTDD